MKKKINVKGKINPGLTTDWKEKPKIGQIVAYSLLVKVFDGKDYRDLSVTPFLDKTITKHLDHYTDRLEKEIKPKK